MVAFNRIYGINHAVYVRCELEVFSKLLPVVLLWFDNDWVFIAPFLIQIKKFCFCRILTDSAINPFQVFKKFLLVFTLNVFDWVAYLMDDAKLYYGIRKYALNGIHPDDRIYIVQTTGASGFYLGKDTVCYCTNCFGRNTVAEIFLHPVTDLTVLLPRA